MIGSSDVVVTPFSASTGSLPSLASARRLASVIENLIPHPFGQPGSDFAVVAEHYSTVNVVPASPWPEPGSESQREGVEGLLGAGLDPPTGGCWYTDRVDEMSVAPRGRQTSRFLVPQALPVFVDVEHDLFGRGEDVGTRTGLLERLGRELPLAPMIESATLFVRAVPAGRRRGISTAKCGKKYRCPELSPFANPEILRRKLLQAVLRVL